MSDQVFLCVRKTKLMTNQVKEEHWKTRKLFCWTVRDCVDMTNPKIEWAFERNEKTVECRVQELVWTWNPVGS